MKDLLFGRNCKKYLPHDAKQMIQNLHHWWQGACVLFLSLWCIALVMSCLYAFKSSEEQFENKIGQLWERSIELQMRLEDVCTMLMVDSPSNDWNPHRFKEADAKASPLFQLSWLDAHGKLKGGNQPPKFEPLGPEPLGYGIPKNVPHFHRPYIVARNHQGETLVIAPNNQYIFGSWLKQCLSDLGFGRNVTVRIVPHHEVPEWALKSEIPRRHWKFNLLPWNGQWEYLIGLQGPMRGPHFGPHPHPPAMPKEPHFGPPRISLPWFMLTLPAWPLIAETLQIHALVLFVGILLLGGFGISIRLTQRALRYELELAQSKSNFTAMVSHELKTPVAALRMYSEMLREGLVTDPKVREEFFATMVDESKRLQRLIENILDLGKIESGNKSVNMMPLEVPALVDEAIRHAQEAYGSSEVPVETDIEPDLPEILADNDLAAQAIANLVHNAFKYAGSIPEILVRAMRRGDLVEIAVLDRGPGIPTEMHESIFEPYRRLGNEETRTSQGTGLGLALVKACQQAQQGTVRITNRPGGGSIFTLTFQPVPKGGEA